MTKDKFCACSLIALLTSTAIAQDPEWVQVPVLRVMKTVRGSASLADVESRMPAGHQYAFPTAPMTWCHETTHGLNSILRMRNPGCNVLYCLDGKACVIREPKGRLSAVSRLIPLKLRGPSFHLYLVQQQRYWECEPTYLLDEWVAYTNGSYTGREVGENGWHYELLQAINFTVYSIAMANSICDSDPSYDHTQLREFIKHNAERTMKVWSDLNASGDEDTHVRQIRAYLAEWRTGTESTSLRKFANTYLGQSLLGE